MNSVKKINLALQGGGAHGAYTWGVLDRLLEDGRITLDGISGTSAGAMNAAVLVDGFDRGKYDGARAALAKFWKDISELALFSPLQQLPWDRFMNGWNLDSSPTYTMFDLYTRMVSPHQRNPLSFNPLRTILEKSVDIERVNAHKTIKLFVTATTVRTGQPRIFHCHEVTIDTLMASACLPTLYDAVIIDGEAYWDGGYTGNPAIWPLIYHCKSDDVMLVQINPFVREEIPTTASAIEDRINEITFNYSLISELRSIQFVTKLLAKKKLDDDEYKNLRMHIIFSPKELHDLNASSKLNANWDFFIYLRDKGRLAASAWLEKNFKNIGVKSTFDFNEVFELKKKPAAIDT